MSPSRMAGYVNLPASAELKLKIKAPETWDLTKVTALIDNAKVEPEIVGEFLAIKIQATADQKASWEIRIGGENN